MDFNLYLFPESVASKIQLPLSTTPFEAELASTSLLLMARHKDLILLWDPMLRLYRQPEKLMQWSVEQGPLLNIFYMPASGMAEYAFFEEGDQSRWVSFDLDGTEAEEMAALGVTPDLSQLKIRQEGKIRPEEASSLDPLALLAHYELDMDSLPKLNWQILPNWPVNN